MQYLEQFFAGFPALEGASVWLAVTVAFFGIILLAVIADIVARRIIVAGIHRFLAASDSERDNIILRNKVFESLSHQAPAIVIYMLAPEALAQWPAVGAFVETAALVYMVVNGVLFFDALINSGQEIYRTYSISRQFPIKSFVQVAKIALYFLGLVAILSLVLGQSPLSLLAGFGALTAVLMFVFKDPILGFVSGIQLSANRMVAVGDWIEMPSYNVDGDVMEIALTTVKIRNFDKTITTVPTQALISESFKNWRGMTETGGRRIKRSLNIDVSTIRFCDEEMLRRFSKIQFLAEYITDKQAELDAYNSQKGADPETLVNGRRLTNVGTFRAYVEAYLDNHPKISNSLTFLVRQLQPTENGLPIEIYVFSLDTNWINYEKIQADIFDHILAAAPEFDLRIFQNPTGGDFRSWQRVVAQ
ncbi:mechanosensitive ion channel family protein [Parvularcula sp. IMCC14364]|uniref:mechanosensitive ion channel family protein n=1 Tax=Parvularcula sp. IMCC14364 TaxID=3067902 RepID=UPI0027416807|nr:mechanosensitive ion channel family protein [Parvularcula sp. IMCC14364]